MDSDENAAGHRLRGAIDGDVLVTLRDVFDRRDPLVTATLDDFVDPTTLTVVLDVGLLEDSTGRFDVQWIIEEDYKFHYTEDELDFRWGYHLHNDDYDVQGYAHFHPSPDASSHPNDVRESCFTVHRPKLVARGVLKNWRAAYHDGLEELNSPDYTG